ncbi:MAG: tannase/feruloyl esterase family alpha/beta hydrolase [Alphaproteobacteria bacterium]|nr:tannase/feruloyl esterase family alpha/beta hydrolase [Alphaproteobacteria bacterium]
MRVAIVPLALAIGVGLAPASSAPPAHASDPSADGAERCLRLSNLPGALLGDSSARIVEAKFNAAAGPQPPAPGTPPWIGGLPALPAHCEVIGVMRERTGSDGQKYAVRFHLRLPATWNGRFLFQGGGGTNGEIGSATGGGQAGPSAVAQGYAVVSTDTGHDNKANANPARQGNVAFGHDYQARLEYAEKALDSVATAGKALVTAFYGTAAKHSYFAGCSNGGREGMVFAQRFPEQFDGIVASAPAFAVPKAAIAEAYDTQLFAALARSSGFLSNGVPDLARTFTDRDFGLVGDAINRACDRNDGLEDGMVQDFRACTAARVKPELAAKLCAGAKTDACLSAGQIDALTRSLAGPRNSTGQALYADWPWDPGIASPLWRIWKIGIVGAPMAAINVDLGSPALSALFLTPPREVGGSAAEGMAFQLGFDFDRDAPQIFATAPGFPRSGWDLVGAQSTDLAAFFRRGGRMVVAHGTADPIFSINDTIRWWDALDRRNRRRAADHVRVFPVPGMNHCAGGPATDQFDALATVVDWVEKGVAPQRISATAGPMSPFHGRSRPLCPYPTVARYVRGDPEKEESFACVG